MLNRRRVERHIDRGRLRVAAFMTIHAVGERGRGIAEQPHVATVRVAIRPLRSRAGIAERRALLAVKVRYTPEIAFTTSRIAS